MTVSLNDIRDVLTRLINEQISREDASNWAMKLMEVNDNDSLEYESIELEEIIWDGIMFILGIDLLVAPNPNSYLYGKVDIEDYLKDISTK